ncbi:MAG: FG-GAP-like repeat-containing protein [Pyrinomonadaceae bacterium]|nr:FG-GAP-like repeat-containing protein [Pyrinomonadaceae bacterium]
MKNYSSLFCIKFSLFSAVSQRAALFLFLSALLLFSGGIAVSAAPGDLDPSFGSAGKVTTPVGNGRDFAQAVAVQSDGKLIVVGYAQNDFALVRYNPNGSLDTSFGTGGNGKVLTAIGSGTQDEAYAVAVQSDGGIIVAGFTINGGTRDFAVVRYLTNGTLDPAFGLGGKVITPVGAGDELAEAAAVQPDGKILVAGSTDLTSINSKFAVVRYNTDGTLDPTFGAGGRAVLAVGDSGGLARTLALQTDGRILVGGSSVVIVGQSGLDKFTLVRLTQNGAVDTSFGTGGRVVTSVSDNRYGTVSDLALQADGKIIAAGNDSGNTNSNTAVVRYQPNGTLDLSFGTGGIVTTRVGSVISTGETVNVQTNGKIVVTGDSSSGSDTDFGIVRLNADGAIDTTFGIGGKIITAIGSRDDRVRDAVLQADGKIVVIGQSENASASFFEDFAVARYLGDAVATRPAPFDFDGDGKTDYGVFRPSEGIWYLLESQAGFAGIRFGLQNDRLVPADYDGDGKSDVAVFRAGTWYLLGSQTGFMQVSFGLTTDIPVPADYDGDGKAEIAIYRPSNGAWWIRRSSDNQISVQNFGSAEDKPVPADYDGDGRTDLAVFRPSSGNWYLLQSAQGFGAVNFGISTDKPVSGDYDGDGKADIAVWRPADGNWWLRTSANGAVSVTNFGTSGDKPVAGDYDGDGKTDIAVWRSSDRVFYSLRSGSGNSFSAVQFGLSSDLPLASAYIP